MPPSCWIEFDTQYLLESLFFTSCKAGQHVPGPGSGPGAGAGVVQFFETW